MKRKTDIASEPVKRIAVSLKSETRRKETEKSDKFIRVEKATKQKGAKAVKEPKELKDEIVEYLVDSRRIRV